MDHYKDYRLKKYLDLFADDPKDEGVKQLFEGELKKVGADKDPELENAARKVHTALKEHNPQTYQDVIGMYIGTLTTDELNVEGVKTPEKGIGVKIDDVETKKATFNLGQESDPNP